MSRGAVRVEYSHSAHGSSNVYKLLLLLCLLAAGSCQQVDSDESSDLCGTNHDECCVGGPWCSGETKVDSCTYYRDCEWHCDSGSSVTASTVRR